jgi:hypothetical protein
MDRMNRRKGIGFFRGAEMKIVMLMLVLLISGCAAYKPMPPEEMVIRKTIEVPGMTRDRIFENSKVWIIRHLYAKGRIINTADREAGVIITNGYINYPATGVLEAIDKIQYTISFTMREEIRDSVILLTFGDLMLDIPKFYRYSRLWPMQEYSGGYSIPIEERADFEAARKGLLDLSDGLADYLNQVHGSAP